MLTKELYLNVDTQSAIKAEVKRTEMTIDGGKAFMVSEHTADHSVCGKGISTSIWLKVLSLSYGKSPEAKAFREKNLYPELFRRDDEEDAPVEVFIPANVFDSMKKTIGNSQRKGVIVRYATTYWWEGELENGMPFVISSISLADKQPPRAPWAVEIHSAPYIPKFNEIETLVPDDVEEEDDFEEDDFEEELDKLADMWADKHRNDKIPM